MRSPDHQTGVPVITARSSSNLGLARVSGRIRDFGWRGFTAHGERPISNACRRLCQHTRGTALDRQTDRWHAANTGTDTLSIF